MKCNQSCPGIELGLPCPYPVTITITLRAPPSSSVDSLYIKAHEVPLQLRCEKLTLQYSTKLRSCPSNPVYDCTFNPKYKQHFERKEKSIKPFGLWMNFTLQESKISLNNIYESILPQTSPWIIKKPEVIFKLNELPKTKTHPSTYQEKFRNILQNHPDHLYAFIDISKDNDKMVCAVVLNKTIIKKALSMEISIIIAEAHAISPDIISKSKHKKFTIFSDSVLQSLSNKKT